MGLDKAKLCLFEMEMLLVNTTNIIHTNITFSIWLEQTHTWWYYIIMLENLVDNEDLIKYFSCYSRITARDLHCHLILSFDKLCRLLSTKIRCYRKILCVWDVESRGNKWCVLIWYGKECRWFRDNLKGLDAHESLIIIIIIIKHHYIPHHVRGWRTCMHHLGQSLCHVHVIS